MCDGEWGLRPPFEIPLAKRGPVLEIAYKFARTDGTRSMSSMIERVAQAAGITPDQARAAITAMREPTEEMIVAWIRAPGAITGGWQGMIDAALER